MGQTDELNTPEPPRFLEKLAGLAVPRGSREQVLGDLHERYVSPLGYLADAATAVPGAVISRLIKCCPLPYILVEFFLAYAGILIAAFLERNQEPIWGGGSLDFWKCAAAAGYLTVALTWRDVYGWEYDSIAPGRMNPRARTLLDRFRMTADAFMLVYFAFGAYYALRLMLPHLEIFPGMMTTQKADWTVPALLLPARIWLRQRRRRPERGV